MSHTSDSLKALTVAKLKELLAAEGLVQAGKKDDLIARLLEAPTTAAPVSTEAPVVEEATTVAVPTPDAPVPVLSTPAAPVVPEVVVPAVVVPTKEELEARAAAEEAKRLARAERFGGDEDALTKRAEKFGTGSKTEAVTKSLAALDRPLGEKMARREKVVKEKAAVVPAVVKAVAPVDPELAAKIEAEEQKKAKRLARFGPTDEPVAKVAKVAPAAST